MVGDSIRQETKEKNLNMQAKQALAALETLQRSKGWNYLNEIMREEVVQAAMSIANSPNMELDEINFRRGSIWAANQLLDLPNRLRLRLENELALASKDDPIKQDVQK